LGGKSLSFRGLPWLASACLIVLLALGAGCGGGSAATPTSPGLPTPSAAPTSPRVVIFSIDGLRPDALARASTPVLSGLAARGAYTWTAQTIMPATTLPSHASMLSGFLPAAHGITWDDFKPEKGPIGVPTIFAIARAAGLRTVLVAGKEKFRQLDQPGTLSQFELCGGHDDEVGNRAVGAALGGQFDLMFVHLPQTDLTGHSLGWMSPAYLAAVEGADRVIGHVLASVPTGTTVIVTADHGGHDRTHGAAVPSDMTIPWIVSGPSVVPRALGRVHTTDTAATAAWVLGLKLAAGASGRPVLEAFAPAAASAARAN
jgi:arylsulfatase A-like enzyme